MHYATAKTILSGKNGMNLYRGCLHGCIYCDSRSKCYQMQHAFEDIEVKENAISLLEQALRHKKKPCMIGMGSMTDPYLPLENTLCQTKKALEVIKHYGFGATLITKSNLCLRDLSLFQEIHKQSKCVIQMTLTTYDERLCKKIEPFVCSTQERIEVLNILRDAGIPTIVWLSPILPFLNDTKENLLAILNACAQAKVKGILCFGMGVTLREGNREYFYRQLDQSFPGLKQKYIQTYQNAYVQNSPNNEELMSLFHGFCQKHGILHNNDQIFQYLNTLEERLPRQISLFDEPSFS